MREFSKLNKRAAPLLRELNVSEIAEQPRGEFLQRTILSSGKPKARKVPVWFVREPLSLNFKVSLRTHIINSRQRVFYTFA